MGIINSLLLRMKAEERRKVSSMEEGRDLEPCPKVEDLLRLVGRGLGLMWMVEIRSIISDSLVADAIG
jgi:hypothetical protein